MAEAARKTAVLAERQVADLRHTRCNRSLSISVVGWPEVTRGMCGSRQLLPSADRWCRVVLDSDGIGSSNTRAPESRLFY